ncbi:hypothetical protein [Paraburkholderia sp. RL17-373-BIF-A]|uniref:hypothetical protein n=1 Tax=Paraburkholderia sp. RL17-373-BIF-A TaxID=3031629 RepID=UPI0038BBC227
MKSNMVMDGAKYGNAGGVGDLLLSILTFGIYAFAKSSKMDQKRAAVEAAIRELNQQIPVKGATIISTKVDGKVLVISEISIGGTPALKVAFGGRNVGIIQNTNLASFKEHLEAEIAPVPKLNEDDTSEHDAHGY